MVNYNPWPLGKVPEHLQRPEIAELRKRGYDFDDAREIVTLFENKVAQFTGAPYAVAVDCCTHAIELALAYEFYCERITKWQKIVIPENTYCSVPQLLRRWFASVTTEPLQWEGMYQIKGTRVIDSAVRWENGMYQPFYLQCLSFQIKKPIPIGRGGVILCSSLEEYQWLKLASYDGRDLNTPYDSHDHVKFPGYHYYMTPEDAARGIILMDEIKFEGITGTWKNYPVIK